MQLEHIGKIIMIEQMPWFLLLIQVMITDWMKLLHPIGDISAVSYIFKLVIPILEVFLIGDYHGIVKAVLAALAEQRTVVRKYHHYLTARGKLSAVIVIGRHGATLNA